MKRIRSLFWLIIPLCLLSCGSQKAMPNYLQSVNDTTGIGPVKIPELRIQKNDQLSIQVISASTRPDVSDVLYNLPSSMSTGTSGTSGTVVPGGVLVDANGNIEYPRIGTLHVEGLTKQQLADTIKRKINQPDSVLTNPSVIIRFLNLKVTVIGEVNNQGVMSIPGERVTILEAIGLAGGINDFGQKDAIKVIREVDGHREVGIVDLSSDKLFESPYFNLVQNDFILVDPVARKAKKADQDQVVQRISLGLSLVTALALLYNIFK